MTTSELLDGAREAVREAVSRARPDPEAEPTVTVVRAAAILGISRNGAYEGVADGSIPSIRIGRRIVVPSAALLKMLEAA